MTRPAATRPMRMPGTWFLSLPLRQKASVCLIPLLIAISVIHTVQAVHTEQAILKGEIIKKGETIARIAATNAELPILSGNMELLHRSASSLLDIKDMAFVEFLGKNLQPLIHEGAPADAPGPPPEGAAVTSRENSQVLEFLAPVYTITPRDDIDMFQEPARHAEKMQIGWTRIGLSKKVMNETARQFVVQGCAFALVFTLCGLFLLHLLISIITRPIASLVAAVQGIREGEYPALETGERGDEIGTLTAEFNRMSHAIRQREERIRDMMEQIQAQNANLDTLVKERTSQLEEANRELRAMDELKTSFLATVSHELRTPLTAVVGFSVIIKRKLKDHIIPSLSDGAPKAQRAGQQIIHDIDIICTEGERLTALINDVLDLTKLESGRTEWDMQPVAMGAVVSRAVAATRVLFDQKGVELREDVEAELPEINGDRDRLIQVVINLLSNAAKFTDGGTVTCRARRTGTSITVSVADEGVGIPAANLENVFEKFKQVGDTLTDRPRGTGLGLPICRQIIDHHGGRIWAESAFGKGSTFFFTVPLCMQAEVHQPPEHGGQHHEHEDYHG